MKKMWMLFAAGCFAAVLCGCEKKGTVSGVVMDPFTGKPVELPTVWMDGSVFGTQTAKYPYGADLVNGKFKFDEVPAGEYLIKARRNGYVLGQQRFTTTPENPNAELTLFAFSDKIDPGLYKYPCVAPDKIQNSWVIWAATCSESGAAYRASFTEEIAKGKKKEKRVNKLPDPLVVDANFSVLFHNKGSVTTPITAVSYAARPGKVKDHQDCKGFGDGETDGIFADKSKTTDLKVTYKAEGLFEVTGTLPKGKQIVQMLQDGKSVQTYYFEVK
ncbi:MAG: carboxypeptidase-like regulatory domain-containing protein [Fibrobacter sp.]|jgi:hypothetical protein|nr:carboxypeptidase-like regulatory domain-containing protein [Fibrobacter sp.]